MTGAEGLFLLESRAAEDGVEVSRDWAGVRSSMMLEGIGSCLTDLTPGSVISIRSSSSSSVAGVTPPRLIVSASFGFDQTPSGSTTTCSTSDEVDRRMSFTYLYVEVRKFETLET